MGYYENSARIFVERAIRKIYTSIETTENDAIYHTFRTLYSEFISTLTDKLRELIRISREPLSTIKTEDSKNIYIDWQVRLLTNYFVDCLKAKEILEYKDYE